MNTKQADGDMAELLRLINEERQRQGITFQELSRRTGIARATMIRWFSHERGPQLATLLLMMRELGITLRLDGGGSTE